MNLFKMELKNWRVGEYPTGAPDGTAPEMPEEWISASVPGCVQYDLVEQGRLDNPYAGTKGAFDAAWVAKSDWLYETVFDRPEGLEKMAHVILKLWGIDTFSEVWLNGSLLGETANAYRSYEFSILPEMLLERGNRLQIRVKAHGRMVEDKLEAAECLTCGKETEGLLGKALIRRYQRSFYTNSSLLNVGTGVLGIGINRPVELYGYPGRYLTDVAYTTRAIGDCAEGSICVSLNPAGEDGTDQAEKTAEEKWAVQAENLAGEEAVVKAEILDGEKTCVWETEYVAGEETTETAVRIENPKLWWPRGYGEPYLYTLKVSVWQNGVQTDEKIIQIGIRTVRLVQRTPSGKKTFYIEVNGQKIFVKGENYIPMDYLKVYGSREQYDNLFLLTEQQLVNTIRIWGGGAVEDESFFRECDRRGILIWHDLFLHSNVYPDYDPEFVENYKEEVKGVLKTIRSHPCICLVCGGNEQQEGWDEWGWKQDKERFFGETLPRVHTPVLVEELCPDIPYIYNSPHGGSLCQSPVEGDSHCWGNYYNSFKDPLFVTETCWTTESYSRPETLESCMGMDLTEYEGKGWADKWNQFTSLPTFNRRPFSSWFETDSLRGYLHALEVEQARADYHALSQLRFTGPSNHGIIYWSFNKGGPLFQFGCVDYGGRPMMSYYVVKRLYQSVAIFPYREFKDVRVLLSNHLTREAEVCVEAFHMNRAGDVLDQFRAETVCPAGETVLALLLEGLYEQVQERTEETVFVRAIMDGVVVSEDLLLFAPYGELQVDSRPMDARMEKTGEREWELTVHSEGIVQMVEIECDRKMVCEDNYFPMMPCERKTVKVTLLEECGGRQPEFLIRKLGEKNGIKLH